MTGRQFDEAYVLEILATIPRGLTLDAFRQACQRDVNAGYWAEVAEAERRYFDVGNQ